MPDGGGAAFTAIAQNEGDSDKAKTGWRPKFWKILKRSTDIKRTVEPQDYLGAISELLALTIFMSLCITWGYSKMASVCKNNGCGIPDFNFEAAEHRLTNNPIFNMVGYNNPCAFWDQPPALYFAFFMFCPMVYFAFIYAITDTARVKLVSRTESGGELKSFQCGCLAINWIYAFSQCLVMGIFVITPHVYGADHMPLDTANPSPEDIHKMHWKMRGHSACFLQLVPVLCITMSANYIEAYMSGVRIGFRWGILVYYVLATALETFFATTAIFLYEGDYSQNPGWEDHIVWPPLFLQIVDYAWFLSLPAAAWFQPPSPDVEIITQIAPTQVGKAEGS